MTRLGLCLPQVGPHATPTAVRGFARRAEELGYDSLWVQERLLRPRQPTSRYAGTGEEIPERFSSVLSPTELMAAVGAWTERVRIGSSVLIAGYHQPVELSKRLATIDVLTGGRLTVGLGVGWSDEEHRVQGVDPRTRGARCDEFVEALLACWGEDPVSYEGEFFSIPPSDIGPKPVQRPHPPLVFGMWSRAGLERTARLADGWSPSGHPVEWVEERRRRIDRMRPPGAPPVTVHQVLFLEPPVPSLRPMTVAQVADAVRACADAGFDEVIIDLALWDRIDGEAAWLRAPDDLMPVLESAGAQR